MLCAACGAVTLPPMQHYRFTVPSSDAGGRLDVWLEDQLDSVSRSQIGRLIKEGHCQMQPGQCKPGWKLRGGEEISLVLPEPEALDLTPEDIPLHILYEDDDILLVDKPPGMVVHPSPGHPRGTLLAAVLAHCGGEPALIHRLDEDTSGLIAVAKHLQAHAFCQAAFQERSVHKRYLALAHGRPKADILENHKALTRHPKDFRKRCVCADDAVGAKAARTTMVVRERHGAWCVLEARPQTGRTHQVRVHLADLGHAVLADRYYSRGKRFPPDASAGPVLIRQALHAWALDLPHPAGGRVRALASIPADFLPWLENPDLRPMGWELEPGSAHRVSAEEPH